MTGAQSNLSMLIISTDSYLVGLLTGYGVANNLSFHSISCAKPLSINNMLRVSRVIIIDIRSIAPILIKAHFELLKKINTEYGVPICAIHSQNDSAFKPDLSWVSYFKDINLLAQLDSYMTRLIVDSKNLYHERRSKSRRTLADRRSVSMALNSASNELGSSLRNGIEVDERVKVGQFEIDHNSRTVYQYGRDLALTAKEFKLFLLLAEVSEQVCSTEKIIAQIWPNTRRANKSDLYQYMHLLRKKIERDPDHPQWILTVKGVGYRLNTNVRTT